MRALRLLALLLIALPSFGQITNRVLFNLSDFTTTPQRIRSLSLYPIGAPFTNAGVIITRDRLNAITGTNGTVYVTNVLGGAYRSEFTGTSTTTTNYFLFPTTNAGTPGAATINAADWVTNQSSAVPAYLQGIFWQKSVLLAGNNTTYRTNGGQVFIDSAVGTNFQAQYVQSPLPSFTGSQAPLTVQNSGTTTGDTNIYKYQNLRMSSTGITNLVPLYGDGSGLTNLNVSGGGIATNFGLGFSNTFSRPVFTNADNVGAFRANGIIIINTNRVLAIGSNQVYEAALSNSVLIGNNIIHSVPAAVINEAVIIGDGAQAQGGLGVTIGNNASGGDSSVVIGPGATTVGGHHVVVIGESAVAQQSFNVVIGDGTLDDNHSEVIVIGHGVVPTSDRTVQIGQVGLYDQTIVNGLISFYTNNFISINGTNMTLRSFDDSLAANWNSRILYDAGSDPSILWDARQLKTSSGVIIVDWANAALNDEQGQAAMNFSSFARTLNDENGNIAIDFLADGGRTLKAADGSANLDWQNKTFPFGWTSLGNFSVNAELSARTNTASMVIQTNSANVVIGTRYTNANVRAFISASWTLASGATATMTVENNVTNKQTTAASSPLFLPVSPGAAYYFTTNGTGTTVYVPGTFSITYW